jgi:hypothetical protein
MPEHTLVTVDPEEGTMDTRFPVAMTLCATTPVINKPHEWEAKLQEVCQKCQLKCQHRGEVICDGFSLLEDEESHESRYRTQATAVVSKGEAISRNVWYAILAKASCNPSRQWLKG